MKSAYLKNDITSNVHLWRKTVKKDSLNAWKIWVFFIFLIAVFFGLATLVSGGSVLFVDGVSRQAAGAYVPFVVWSNFIAGFAYIIAGFGILFRRQWSRWVSLGVLVFTLVVFAFLILHVMNGGAYESRTIYAMTLRATVWTVVSLTAWRACRPQPQ